jgi:hypothetical protein
LPPFWPNFVSARQTNFTLDKTFQIFFNQADATISQVYYLNFTHTYSSTCFGHPHAYHQEVNNCSSSLWFYRWSVVVAVLLVLVRPVGQHCYHHTPMVKPEAATAVVDLLMMGVRMPETCWAVCTSKLQTINLRNFCIWLVHLFETYDDAWTCKL